MAATGAGGVAWAASKPTKSPAPAAQAPAASGQISYISGDTMEVRNEGTGQTTVKITSKTAITATVAVTLKAVAKGSCITASGTKAKNGVLDATTVTVVAATDGKCGANGVRPAGGSGAFGPRTAGAGAHGTGAPGAGSSSTGASSTGAPGRKFTMPANEATASGKVASVAGKKVTVEGTTFSLSSSADKRTTATAAPKQEKVTVEVGSKTKYLKMGTGSAKSLKVGECATAFGSTSSIGAVTAVRLTVTPATSGSCASF